MDTLVRYPQGVQNITISGSNDRVEQRIVKILTGMGAGAMYGVHNNSVTNLVRGIAERVLYIASDEGLTPCRKPLVGAFNRLHALRAALVNNMTPTPVISRDQYPGLYNGRKHKIYTKAYESLVVRPIRIEDSYCSTFVKAEKINFSTKGDPAPRVIQPRSPRYNLEIGRYLKLMEKELSRGFEKLCGYKVILKGLNADGVAGQLRANWDSFRNPIAIGLDASRFDQHVSVDALEFEHGIYNMVFRSRELARLLKWQLHNRGYGRVGETLVSYRVDGCRMSGDINTGMGNCAIMSTLVLNYFEEVGLKARLSNNGDDCVVILERGDEHKMANIGDYFTEFGFNLKIEPTVTVFEKIEFCQTQPVLVGGEYRMVRNPWTAMSKDCVSLLNWENLEQFNTWRAAIGTCGTELTRGVPIWESFYAVLGGGHSRTGGVERIYDSGMGYMARGVRECLVDDKSRYSFWLAFDILPDIQVAMENNWPTIAYTSSIPMITLQESIINSNILKCLA